MSRIETLKTNIAKIRREDFKEQRDTILDKPDIRNDPLPVRKAKALDHYLSTVPIHIYPEELIVGIPFTEKPDPNDPSTRILPPQGISGQLYIDAANSLIEQGYKDEAHHPIIETLQDYGVSTRYGLLPHYALPDEIQPAKKIGLNENSHPGHHQAGNQYVIKYGWIGLQDRAKQRLESLDPESPEAEKRKAFLESVIICLEAAKNYANRYSELAKEQAKTVSPRRRKELEKISQICHLVTTRAPESWWEALQLQWFSHLINHANGAHQIGRFDQYMWPTLKHELEQGTIESEEAQELLECLWLKYSSITDYTSDNLQNIILGGVTSTGEDATNPLTYMCLEATDKLGAIDPKWNIRIHRDSPDRFLLKAAEMIKKNQSMPGIYNDEPIIEALTKSGVPLEDARDYTNDGCSEILIGGKTSPWAFEGKLKLLKCLERATWKLTEYPTYDSLLEAVKQEIAQAVEKTCHNIYTLQSMIPKIAPNPWLSASVDGCVESMRDLTDGGPKYNSSTVNISGVADTADSLAAIKKLVYEEKKITPETIVSALQSNFEEDESLRLMLLNRAPKYGNDDDYVDSIAAELVSYIASEVSKYRNSHGTKFNLGLFSYGDYISHGMMTGATPDGRKAGEGLSPNFSPSPGRDSKGPYAVMKSTSKIDSTMLANGYALDVMIHPTALMGDEGAEKLVDLLRSYNNLGGMQVQFNIVDGATLRAAQANPEKYKNLTVRLWGLPAYFTQLPKEFQDHLINRTDNAL